MKTSTVPSNKQTFRLVLNQNWVSLEFCRFSCLKFDVVYFLLQPVLGYGSQDAMPFKQTKDAELSFVDDGELNLPEMAEDKKLPFNMGAPSVRGIVSLFDVFLWSLI